MSDRGAKWYKREPRAFLEGVRRLTERQTAVYAVILDLIYDGGHRTHDDPKHIASYFSDLGAAAVRRTIDELIQHGKLMREDGFLTNKRAKNEGKTWRELTENRRNAGRLGGVRSGKSRAKSNDFNEVNEASASSFVEADKSRVDIEDTNVSSLSETISDDAAKTRKKIVYPEQFEEFWKAYPTTVNMSKKEALDAWKKLDDSDKAKCLQAVAGYRTYLKSKPGHETIHACRFIRNRRFDGYAGSASSSASSSVNWPYILQRSRRIRRWSTVDWGPPPGAPDCRVPPDLLEPGDGVGWNELETAA